MAKLTSRSLSTGVTLNDLIHIVNTSDLSQSVDGSSYKATISQLVPLFDGTYVTGSTFNTTTNILTLTRNDNVSLTTNLSSLATDVYVVSGVYNNSTGIVTFTNSTGGTFNVSGFVTGFTDTKVTGGTYSNGTATFTNSSGGTFNVTGFTMPFTGGSSNCITDFYVTNVYGCSPIRIHDDTIISGISANKLGINKTPSYTFDILSQNNNSQLFYNDSSTNQGFTLSGNTNGLYYMSVDGTDIGAIRYGVVGKSSTGNTVYGVTGDSFVYSSVASNGLNIISSNGTGTSDHISFYAGKTATSSPDLHIKGSGATKGYIGIGTITPTEKLHVSGNTIIEGDLVVNNGSQSIFSGNSSSDLVRITQLGSGNALIVEDSINPDSTPFVVTNAGDVGIGTNSPQDILHIKGNAGIITLEGTDHVYINFYPDGYSDGRKGWFGFGNSGDDNITLSNQTVTGGTLFKTNDISRLFISSSGNSGNVGVGTVLPNAKLDVFGTMANGSGTTATGIYSHAEGYNNTAIGNYSHVEGYSGKTYGLYSHAEGEGTVTSGQSSHAEGRFTTARGGFSHAEGVYTLSYGSNSHAEGYQTISSGDSSHSEGRFTTALDNYSHAEGERTTTGGFASHAEGYSGYTIGDYSHVEGRYTTSVGNYSHAEGDSTTSNGAGSHSEGLNTLSQGSYSHAEGNETGAYGSSSHAEGYQTIASGSTSHAEGYQTISKGNYSHAEGDNTIASGATSHAEGRLTISVGQYSHSEGLSGTTIGSYSHAEGEGTIASGYTSHAEGYRTNSNGSYSHSEGNNTTASGNVSHAEGDGTTSIGYGSHAEGYQTTSTGDYSHAEGRLTNAYGDYSHVEGLSGKTYGLYSHAEGEGTIASGYTSHSEGYQTTTTGDYSHSEGYITTANGDSSHAEGKYTIANNQSTHSGGNGFNSSNKIIASGNTSFVHYKQTSASGYIGAYGDYSAILGGTDHNITSTSTSSAIIGGNSNDVTNVSRSVVLGGQNINATRSDYVYTPNIIINTGGTSSRLGINTSNPEYVIDAYGNTMRLNMLALTTEYGGAFDGARQMLFSGTTSTAPAYVLTDGVIDISLGVRGTTTSNTTYMQGLGITGDTFIGSSAAANGLNICQFDSTPTNNKAHYIRFFAGKTANSANTPDIHIQGSGATIGYVGFNTKTPTQQIDVNGNGRFRSIGSSASAGALHYTSDGTLTTNTSDQRLKTNINTINNALDKIKNLRGVTYNWNEEPNGNVRIGFIAQEVNQVVPELTFVNKNTPEEYMGVHYDNVTALLVEAVKDMSKTIDELKEEIRILKNK